MSSDSTSYFPLQQDDDLPIICPEFSLPELEIGHIFNANDLPKAKETDNEKGKQPEILQDIEGGAANQKMQKKVVRRDIERQRRKEMSQPFCFSSFGSSCSVPQGEADQVDEATKYIRCLQNNIKQLEKKRENRKGSSKKEGSSSKSSSPPIVVTVQPCSVGVDFLIGGDFMAEGLTLHLSRILQLLLDEGLNVVDCNCTKFDERFHYVIQSECQSPNAAREADKYDQRFGKYRAVIYPYFT